jgi:hypothetical protein
LKTLSSKVRFLFQTGIVLYIDRTFLAILAKGVGTTINKAYFTFIAQIVGEFITRCTRTILTISRVALITILTIRTHRSKA